MDTASPCGLRQTLPLPNRPERLNGTAGHLVAMRETPDQGRSMRTEENSGMPTNTDGLTSIHFSPARRRSPTHRWLHQSGLNSRRFPWPAQSEPRRRPFSPGKFTAINVTATAFRILLILRILMVSFKIKQPGPTCNGPKVPFCHQVESLHGVLPKRRK